MPWTTADVGRFKSGLTDRQERQWVRIANDALSRCQARSGSNCDASAIRQANAAIKTNIDMETQVEALINAFVNTNSEYMLRRETRNGKNYIVVPVTMMVEGVHDGNRGPLFHSAEELGAAVDAWNDRPVTIQHPEDADGNFVSVDSLGIAQEYEVGRIFSSRMEGAKLKSEAWIDEQRIRMLSPEALAHIEQGAALEVSAGLFSVDEETTGEYQGVTYNAIARNHIPDHLALLPGGTGACSWEDGCGIRANKEGGKDVKNKNDENQNELNKEQHLAGLIANAESGYREVMGTIQSKLDGMDTDIKSYYLEDVYDDYFVYTVRSREGGTPSKLYKRGYTVNENGELAFEEEPSEVRKQVSYVTLSKGGIRRTKFNNNSKKEVNTMSDKKKPCCEDVVLALIANEKTPYNDEDKVWLLALEENQVAKLVQNAKEVKEDPPEKEVTPQLNAEQVKEIVKETFNTSESFMELAPDELKEQLRSGLRLHQEARARMVKSILDNTSEGIWKEDNLKGMEIETLERIFKSVVNNSEADYSLLGEAPVVNTNEQEPLLTPFLKKAEAVKA